MSHKKVRGCIIAIAIPVVLILILFAGIKWRISYAKTEILTSSSDNGSYHLIVYMIGEPDWPFGATHCRFDLFNDNRKITEYSFSIMNDGGNVHEGNFHITWNTDHVTVLVSGSEQSDEIYELNYDGTVE